MSKSLVTSPVLHQIVLDKYPCYNPKHWYLSIIKPKGSRFKHIVNIRPLAQVPTVNDISEEDVKRWQVLNRQ